MKKMLFLLVALLCFSAFCFAQPVSTASRTVSEKKAVAGKVESVAAGDAAKGVLSQIVILDEKGAKSTFSVKPSTVIYDNAGKAISLDKIKKDDTVKVTYVQSSEGVKKAVSISLK